MSSDVGGLYKSMCNTWAKIHMSQAQLNSAPLINSTLTQYMSYLSYLMLLLRLLLKSTNLSAYRIILNAWNEVLFILTVKVSYY
uniref:Uncharacterized protein n=1 Tax=Glossina pallidipes TaxID=7398 RepID=A0A1A9ZUD6_GLOPL